MHLICIQTAADAATTATAATTTTATTTTAVADVTKLILMMAAQHGKDVLRKKN